MKSLVSGVFFVFFFIFFACQQNAPAPPTVNNPAPTPENPPKTNETKVVSIEMIDPGPVVRDPKTTTYKIERRTDGDLQPIFLTQTVTQVVGGKNLSGPSTFSLTSGPAMEAIKWMEKIGGIHESDFKPAGPPMVGVGAKTYIVTRSDGSAPQKITLHPGCTADAAFAGLDKLVASEVSDFEEAKSGLVDKTVAFLEGKVWQSNSDSDLRVSFRDGKMVTFHKGGEDAAHFYTSFRRYCPDGCGTMTVSCGPGCTPPQKCGGGGQQAHHPCLDLGVRPIRARFPAHRLRPDCAGHQRHDEHHWTRRRTTDAPGCADRCSGSRSRSGRHAGRSRSGRRPAPTRPAEGCGSCSSRRSASRALNR